jgi:hypothetical protein
VHQRRIASAIILLASALSIQATLPSVSTAPTNRLLSILAANGSIRQWACLQHG